jgi:Glycosyl transferases group 1
LIGRNLLLMKLIVAEMELLRRYVSREFFYVMTELIETYNWKQIGTSQLWRAPGKNLERKLLDSFGELPEVILFWEAYEFLCAHRTEILRLKSRKAIWVDDLHSPTAAMRREKVISFALCDTVLSAYGYVWAKFFPDFWRSKRVVWIPHSASPDFMLDYNHSPANTVFLSGAISGHYPLRQQMMRLYSQGTYSITYHGHPGYHCRYNYEADENVGHGYATKINKCYAGITDCAKYKYVVAKHFEIPATGALLLANNAVRGPLKKLGFIENQHYVSFCSKNLETKLRYVLANRNQEKLHEVRRRAQKLVWARHKTSDRAREINDVCGS